MSHSVLRFAGTVADLIEEDDLEGDSCPAEPSDPPPSLSSLSSPVRKHERGHATDPVAHSFLMNPQLAVGEYLAWKEGNAPEHLRLWSRVSFYFEVLLLKEFMLSHCGACRPVLVENLLEELKGAAIQREERWPSFVIGLLLGLDPSLAAAKAVGPPAGMGGVFCRGTTGVCWWVVGRVGGAGGFATPARASPFDGADSGSGNPFDDVSSTTNTSKSGGGGGGCGGSSW